MTIGPSMIEQLEDLRSLSTGQLKGMLGTPSPHASPVFIAMVLKEREDAEKRHAGRDAAAEAAGQAPTVSARLQQPVPMSQAGAMAAPPRQPPMPQASQLAMALSGATGRPPPQLPTVNMQRGTTGAAVREIAKALRKEGTRSYAQRRGHQPFSSSKRPPPVYNEGGLGALITAIVKAESEKSKAYGGFDISEDIRLPRGRGRTVAAARPVTAANGTQGRTVYAQFGSSDIAQDYQLLQSLRQPTWGADQYDSRGNAKEGSDLATYNIFMDSVLDKYGGSKGYAEALRLAGIVEGDAAEPVSVEASNQAEFERLRKEFPPANFDQLFPAQAILDDRTERPAMTKEEGAAFAAALGEGLGATERMPVEQAAPSLSPEQARRLALEYGSYAEGMGQRPATEVAPEIVARRTSPPRRGNIPNPRFTEAEQYRQYGNMILADQAALAQTGEARGWEDFIIPTGGDAGVAQRVYEQQQEEARRGDRSASLDEALATAGFQYSSRSFPDQVEINQLEGVTPPQLSMDGQQVVSSVAPPVVADAEADQAAAWNRLRNILPGGGNRRLSTIQSATERYVPPNERAVFDPGATDKTPLFQLKQQPRPSVTGVVRPDDKTVVTDVEVTAQERPVVKAVDATEWVQEDTSITETDAGNIVSFKEWPKTMTPAPRVADGREAGLGEKLAAIKGQLTTIRTPDAPAGKEPPGVAQATDSYLETLNKRGDKIYSDLKGVLDELRDGDAKDFKKLETRFKALDDFYKTGKLPERMRQDRITNLMLEMSKGLLGNQDLYSAFKAGVEGFQVVDKAARKEYAEGLAAMLTASKDIIDSKMASRNARRQETIAMTRFAAEQNRGNVALAQKNLELGMQAKRDARLHKISLVNAETNLLQAETLIVKAGEGTETERLLKSLGPQMYPALLAEAKAGNPAELNKYFRRDSQGKVHERLPAIMKLIGDMKRGGATDAAAAALSLRIGGAQQSILADAKRNTDAIMKSGYHDVAWAAIAAHYDMPKPDMNDWDDKDKKAAWRQRAQQFYEDTDRRNMGLARLPRKQRARGNLLNLDLPPK